MATPDPQVSRPSARPRTLVTGCADRVGRACACEFARRGHDLVMIVRTLDARAQASKAAALAAGGAGCTVDVRACDLEDLDAVGALGGALAQSALDAIVHCAAIYEAQSIGAITAESALGHYKVNALAPLLLVQSLRGSLARSSLAGGGAIVLFSDMHVQGRFYSGHAGYFASKGAVDALVGALAVELGPTIRCNAIAPGVVAFPEGSDPEFVQRYIDRTPLKRAGTPEEAAACAAWLAIDATFVNGEVIRLDGGRFHR